MSAIHAIQWQTASAVLALRISKQDDATPIRGPVSALRALALGLLPLGMVTAAALLTVEVRTLRGVSPSALGGQSRRLDLAATEPMLLEPLATVPAVEAPSVHAAASVDEVMKNEGDIHADPPWRMTPPPVPERKIAHPATRNGPHPEHGVFLTTSSAADDAFMEDTMRRIADIAHPALVIDIKGSNVYIPSGAPMATEMGLVRPIVKLPVIVEEAHRKGIAVIGRYIALKDPSLASRKPETQIRHPLRSRSVGNLWVDGENATTLQYNREILEELVTSGIDEINFDYIRYPTEYAQTDIRLSGKEKAEHIGAFLRMARDVIDVSGRDVKLGISTYAILGWNFPVNFEAVGQDIPEFAKIVDVISPMAYPSTFAMNAYYDPARDNGSRMYHLVWKTIMGYRELVGPENVHKIRPWIQGYGVTEKNMHDQIQAAFDAGACGFTVWNASNAYGPAYKAMGSMQMPEHCK